MQRYKNGKGEESNQCDKTLDRSSGKVPVTSAKFFYNQILDFVQFQELSKHQTVVKHCMVMTFRLYLYPKQVIWKQVPLLAEQHKLVPVNGNDVLKMEGN